MQRGAGLFHLIFEDEHALVAGTDDRDDLVACLVEGLRDRKDRRYADAAADADDCAEFLDVARFA